MKSSGIPLPLLVLFAVLAVVGTRMHVDWIDTPNVGGQHTIHQQIVTHTAPAPYQYRILQPLFVDTVLKLSSCDYGTWGYFFLFRGAYASVRFFSILITLTAVFLALRMICTRGAAAWGATLLAAILPFTYRYYYYQPTSVLEMAFFALGLLATLKRKPLALLPLVALGTLNRETMCFIPLLYFMYWLPDLKREEYKWLGASAFIYVLIMGGLRVLWPASKSLLDVPYYVSENLTLSRGNLDLLVLLSPFIVLLFRVKRMPASFWRLAVCSIPWLVLHFLTSQWYEIRYYMPMFVWLLPCLAYVLVPEDMLRENTLEQKK